MQASPPVVDRFTGVYEPATLLALTRRNPLTQTLNPEDPPL